MMLILEKEGKLEEFMASLAEQQGGEQDMTEQAPAVDTTETKAKAGFWSRLFGMG